MNYRSMKQGFTATLIWDVLVVNGNIIYQDIETDVIEKIERKNYYV